MEMTQKNILSMIEVIFREQFLDDKLCVTEDTSPETIEEWDSVAHINLIVALETKFGVRFTAEEIVLIDSVAVLKRLLMEKIQLDLSHQPNTTLTN